MRVAGPLVLLSFCSSLLAQPAPPKLSALSAIVIDSESGRVLYSKNPNLRLHPASTTKIMTGMLLAELCRPEEVLTAPLDIGKVKESSMHLMPGEQVTAGEMLYALMLRSANDGCHTVALHLSGSEVEFAKLMNARAKKIGCTNTNFVNPHGLTDPRHLTTARDLSLMAREAMKDPLFAKVVGTQKHVLQRSLNLKDTLLVSRDRWLASDPRARGVKTGWTKPAGHCFVGCATDSGMTVITAILKSDHWLDDQKAMTAWVFDNFEHRKILRRGDLAGSVQVHKGQARETTLVISKDVWAVVPKNQSPGFELEWDKEPLNAPVAEGEVSKQARVVFQSGESLVVGLNVGESVKGETPFSTMAAPGGIIGFVLLSGCAMLMRARSRRWAKDIHIR